MNGSQVMGEGGMHDHPLEGAIIPTPAGLVPDALCRSFEALRPRLASYLRVMLPDHHAVEDCLQDTLLVLIERYPECSEDDLRPLAFTCARYKARAWLTKNKVGWLSVVDPDSMSRMAEAASAAVSAGEDGRLARIDALRGCLAALSAKDQELVEARYGEDREVSVLALAETRGRKCDALYKKLERLRQALRRCVTLKLTTSR